MADNRYCIHQIFRTQGLLSIGSNYEVKDRWGLSMVYTPGVGKCCKVIEQNPEELYNLTSVGNTIFVMSNGSTYPDFLKHKPSFMLPELELASYCYKAQGNINAYPLVFDSNIIRNEEDTLWMLKAVAPSTIAVELYKVDRLFYQGAEDKLSGLSLIILLPEHRQRLSELLSGSESVLYYTNLVLSCVVKALSYFKRFGVVEMSLIETVYAENAANLDKENEYALKYGLVKSVVSYYKLASKSIEPITLRTVVDFMSPRDHQKLFYRKFKQSPSDDNSLFIHRIFKGMVRTMLNVHIGDLKTFLRQPGAKYVQELCENIYDHESLDLVYTIKKNYCAIITNGTAVLGFGNIGPKAGLPVMEGKACLFKQLGEVNVLPLAVDTKGVDETVKIVEALANSWVGINLEDIGAPDCFQVESQLKQRLPIPVFHDDQHGTAIVVLAGLINALKVAGREKDEVSIVVNGAGAAGKAVVDLLLEYGFPNIIAVDSKGAIHEGRSDIEKGSYKLELATRTNRNKEKGKLGEVLKSKDVFIGLSVPGSLKKEWVKNMNKNPIVFALANPDPEINPDEAKEAGVFIMATGRSDFPNQINNSLAFPGIFKGLIDSKSSKIDMRLKLRAAEALSRIIPVSDLTTTNLLPYSLDSEVAKVIAQSIFAEVNGAENSEVDWIKKVKL